MRPDDRRYLKSHEWAKQDGELVTFGLTDFAVEQLTDLVFLDLPQVGTTVTRGEEFGEIESVKAVSALYAPMSGEVAEIHETLADDLDKLSSDPFGEGWMVRIRPANAGEYDELLDAAAYEQVVASQA